MKSRTVIAADYARVNRTQGSRVIGGRSTWIAFSKQEKTSDQKAARDVDCLRVRRNCVRTGTEVGHRAQGAGCYRSQERRHPGAESRREARQGREEGQSQGREKSQEQEQGQGEERRSQEVRSGTRS